MTDSKFTYYFVLIASYGVALLGWWLASSKFPSLLVNQPQNKIQKPWLQVVGVIVAGIITILIGRLYSLGFLLPKLNIDDLNISESINQLLIFIPFFIFLLITKQSWASAWLPFKSWYYRLGAGIILSIMAILVFVVLSQKRSLGDVISNVYHIKNTHYLVQIFMEDFAIALLLSRLATALGSKFFIWALMIVGVIFAGGHIPNNLEDFGVTFSLISLSLDAGLLIFAGVLLYRSRDFLWIWPIHFAMDMMQFYSGL